MTDRLQELLEGLEQQIAEVRVECERREILRSQWPVVVFQAREMVVMSGGVRAKLATSLQFRLLKIIWNSKNHRMTEERAARRIWGSENVSSRAIYMAIRRSDELLEAANFPYTIRLDGGYIQIQLVSEKVIF